MNTHLLLAALLLPLCALARPDAARLEAIKAKLDAAQAQLDAAIEAAEAEAPPPSSLEELQEQIAVLEEDVSELISAQERQGRALEQDRIDWTVAYRAALNNVLLKNEAEHHLYGNIWNHRLRLGFHARSGQLRFSGRLAAFKNFGESDERPIGADSNSTRYARDTSLRLERAFIDLFVNDWLALTLGRVASPEGPPAELREHSARSGTWGVQMVEAEFETMLATFILKPIQSSLRVFYSPFFSHAEIDPMDENSLFKDSGIKPTHIWGLLFESRLPTLGDNLLQLGFVHVPKFRPRRFTIASEGEALAPTTLPDDVGSYVMLNGLLELKEQAGFDLFLAGSVTLFDPSDPILYEAGGRRIPMGLATYGEAAHHAWMTYIGARYRLPLRAPILAPRIGLEYNHGSAHHVTWGSPSETLFNKLGARGDALEGYLILPIRPDLFARLGALHIARDHVGGFFGPSRPVDERVTNAYLLVNARWM